MTVKTPPKTHKPIDNRVDAPRVQVVLGWYEGKQKVDLSDYVPSGTWDVVEWDVVECPGELENKRDPGEPHNRSQIRPSSDEM